MTPVDKNPAYDSGLIPKNKNYNRFKAIVDESDL